MSAVDTDVLIIGAGVSGLGLGIQLKRKLGHNNFRILEKGEGVGGTWLANTYPGCRCDVPSHFYSFSFALKPDWTTLFPGQAELKTYFENVASHFGMYEHISFGVAVDSAVWQSAEARWLVTVTDYKQKKTYTITARAVASCVGSLSIPKKCEIPGHETFKGKIFHSAQWDHSFDWTNKDVVTIGNGCSATQFVPVMTYKGPENHPNSGPVKKMTQFSRQTHYLFKAPNVKYAPIARSAFRHIPGLLRAQRILLYFMLEFGERGFAPMHFKRGQRTRNKLAKEFNEYLHENAPEKYWDDLKLRDEIFCKRRVIDTHYLACLNSDNMELISNDPTESIEPEGVRTRGGRLVKADAIVLATGFELHRYLYPMKIVGEGGLELHEHYAKNCGGAPGAYIGTLTANFPNFFMMMGPNTVTGHTSVIFSSECQILLTLGLLKPILKPGLFQSPATVVEVKPEAAARDIANTRETLKEFVWSAGCTSWALDPGTNTNIAMYHNYQWHFWLRCLFLRSNDFTYRIPGKGRRSLAVGYGWQYLRRAALLAALLAVAVRTGRAKSLWAWATGTLHGLRTNLLGK